MVSKSGRWKAAFLIVYCMTAGCLMLRAQVPIEVGSRDRSGTLPDGEGKALVLATCVQCHSLGAIVLQRKNRSHWEGTVHDMVSRGAQVRAEEIPLIANYLAKNFSTDGLPIDWASERPNSAPDKLGLIDMSVSANPFPEGAGKALIMTSCLECHGLDRITDTRKDEAGWQASVKDMITLGAKITPSETVTIVAYLAQHFNRRLISSSAGSTSAQNSPIASGSRPAPAENRAVNTSASLPDGEGKALILATCVQCHNLSYVAGRRKTPQQWKHTVEDMVARGAQLTVVETEIMTNYLAQHMSK